MVSYNPNTLKSAVERLENKARITPVLYAMTGALLGYLGGGELDAKLGVAGMQLLGPVILGLLGFFWGRERAFHLRLEAQNTLCHLRLADGTRALMESSRRQTLVTRDQTAEVADSAPESN